MNIMILEVIVKGDARDTELQSKRVLEVAGSLLHTLFQDTLV
jgi:hypothetical protein